MRFNTSYCSFSREEIKKQNNENKERYINKREEKDGKEKHKEKKKRKRKQNMFLHLFSFI
jgi:hypothetical protein